MRRYSVEYHVKVHEAETSWLGAKLVNALSIQLHVNNTMLLQRTMHSDQSESMHSY